MNQSEALSLDYYQSMAATTAIYPRVYTEDQVREMFDSYESNVLYSNMSMNDAISAVLDDFETPFSRLVYPVLGLVGEAGEIANKLKKVARDGGGKMSSDLVEALADETGDVLWYVSAVSKELNVSLNSVAKGNLVKLFGRKERGVLSGSGDNR